MSEWAIGDGNGGLIEKYGGKWGKGSKDEVVELV